LLSSGHSCVPDILETYGKLMGPGSNFGFDLVVLLGADRAGRCVQLTLLLPCDVVSEADCTVDHLAPDRYSL
jgi:hypothetical protein